MRKQEIQLLRSVPRGLERLAGHRFHGADGVLEHVVSAHADVVELSVDRFVRRGMERAAPGHFEQIRQGPVAVELRGQNPAGLSRRAEHDGAGRVAEEHTRVAIGPVDDLRKGLDPDHEHGVRRSGRDLRAPKRERIEKPGAGGGDIEPVRPGGAEAVLHETRGRGKRAVSRHGPDDDLIELFRLHPGIPDGATRRFGGERGGGCFGIGDAALLDPGPRRDPLDRGIDDLFQVLVGQHAVRRAGSDSDDMDVARG